VITRAFLLRRFLQSVITILGLMTIIFIVFRVMPGDPLAIMVSEGRLDAQAQAQILAQFGLDQPLHVQYFLYLRNLLSGNLGRSFFFNRDVSEIITAGLVNTIVLVIPAMIAAIVCGVLIGALLGWRRGAKLEVTGVLLAMFVRSLPVFWLCILLLMIFTYGLGLTPSGGMFTPGYEAVGIKRFFSADFLQHLTLPFIASFLVYLPVPMLLMRNSMIEVKGEDFLELVKAKGATEPILIRHGLRNGLLPVVTYIAVMSTYIIEGNVLLEVVFSWPGMGRQLVDAVIRRDYPVAQAAFFVMGVLLVTVNFLTDILYCYLDPRVSYEDHR
jgi:peptide/nickel transport system permease protein